MTRTRLLESLAEKSTDNLSGSYRGVIARPGESDFQQALTAKEPAGDRRYKSHWGPSALTASPLDVNFDCSSAAGAKRFRRKLQRPEGMPGATCPQSGGKTKDANSNLALAA
jgi:hypothetical protein